MSGRPFAARTIELEEVTSTNDVARELVLRAAVDLPLAVRASRQTRGRGRGSNSWWSDEGSLAVTLALDPAAHGLSPAHEPRLALAVAVAVVDSVLALGPVRAPLGVRWPNDVEAAGRKLCGILPERVETPSGVRLLVGIGVNVRTRLDEAPADLRRMATSLAETLGEGTDVPEPGRFLGILLEHVGATLPRLVRDDPDLAGRWAGLDTLLHRSVRVNLGGRLVSGVGRGIDHEGALILDAGGETLRLFGGQVIREG